VRVNDGNRTLRVAGGEINVDRPLIVGVVNATPDSFSDRGDRSTAGSIDRVLEHLEDGADLIEIGGESNVTNRPAVTAGEELDRVLPVIEAAVAGGAIVSVDTYKAEVADRALAAGAAIVNDISGSGSDEMLAVCATHGAGIVVMHTEVAPKEQVWAEDLYPDGVAERLNEFFGQRLESLEAAGIGADQVILDPGPDFAKTPRQTVDALRAIPELIGKFGCPVMLAVSRKDFVGALTGRRPRQRGAGTLGAISVGLDFGARILRVHDVAATADFLAVRAALEGEAEVEPGLRIDEAIRREPPQEPDG
jgi:dihydropteroate synthase